MARQIFDTLRHLEGGCFIDEASEKLAEAVKAVDSTGKPATLTLKIDIRMATAGAMAVRGTIILKKPVDPPIEALMWGTPDGNLISEDPSQGKLDLRPIAVETKTELKQING